MRYITLYKKLLFSSRVPFIFLAVSLTYIAVLGVSSIDFGHHWDEHRIISSVATSVETGLLLPRWYNYPSFPYDIALVATIPKAISSISTTSIRDGLKFIGLNEYLSSSTFKLQLRSLFFLLTICAGLAIYFFVNRLSGNQWISLFAALMLASSWEFFYHARWIAPDSILAFLIACSLLCQYQILLSQDYRKKYVWIVISSVLAGLCIGTKYPGGIILIPLFLAIGLAPKTERVNKTFLTVVSLLIVSGTFVLTTPGSVIEPVRFLRDILAEIDHYGSAHGGYTVVAGLDHFSKLLVYLMMVAPSKSTILAVMTSMLMLVGIISLIIKKGLNISIWLLSVPVLYICYMSLQNVMMVRNYLLLIPFLATFTALGLLTVIQYTKHRYPRFLAVVGSIVLISYNLNVVTRSAISIISQNTLLPSVALKEHISSSPETKFYLSPVVFEILKSGEKEQYTNITENLEIADKFIFVSGEVVKHFTDFKANKLGRYHTVWSQVEQVNWDYYPTWIEDRRILEISPRDQALTSLVTGIMLKKN